MKLYNSLTKEKQEFVPLNKGEITWYSCGPTVYNYIHIGNARPFVVFDALRSYFEYLGYNVKFAQNFTDVDDKIINRSKEENLDFFEVGKKYIAEYEKDAKAIGINPATYHPKATETIEEIIEFVQDLIGKGHAYEVDGDVYFDVASFKGYGMLSHQPLDAIKKGARIEVDEIKKDATDFALWKKKKPDETIAWESPWGLGRPGWHIECSAMSRKFLGKTIDIHSGGQDLIFPHHENEVAQSECANGCEFARFWLHNGYINIDNVKMSKSLGNFKTVREILESGVSGEELRFFLLSSHYRSPMNYSGDIILQASAGLSRLKNCRSALKSMLTLQGDFALDYSPFADSFFAGLNDDFNTAIAIASLFDFAKEINTIGERIENKKEVLDKFDELAGVLRLFYSDDGEISDDAKELASQRDEARKNKDWAKSDELRDKLIGMGFEVKDTPNGTVIC